MTAPHFIRDIFQKMPCDDCPHRIQVLGRPSVLRKSMFPGPPVESSGGRGRPDTLSQAAVKWLGDYLKGPKPAGNRHAKKLESRTVFGDAGLAGFKSGTIWNAAQVLGVRKEKIGKRWYWSLPTENNRCRS